MVSVFKACTEWYWSIHTFEEQNRCSLQSSKLKAKAEFTETCPLVTCCPAVLSFHTGMNATLFNHMGLGVCGLLQSLQLRSSVGCNIVSPVAFQCGAVSNKFFPWRSSVPCKYSLGCTVVSQCTLCQPVAFQCTLDQPVYSGSGSGIVKQVSDRCI